MATESTTPTAQERATAQTLMNNIRSSNGTRSNSVVYDIGYCECSLTDIRKAKVIEVIPPNTLEYVVGENGLEDEYVRVRPKKTLTTVRAVHIDSQWNDIIVTEKSLPTLKISRRDDDVDRLAPKWNINIYRVSGFNFSSLVIYPETQEIVVGCQRHNYTTWRKKLTNLQDTSINPLLPYYSTADQGKMSRTFLALLDLIEARFGTVPKKPKKVTPPTPTEIRALLAEKLGVKLPVKKTAAKKTTTRKKAARKTIRKKARR